MFKKRINDVLDKIREEAGYCMLPNTSYAFIPGHIYSRKHKGMIEAAFHYRFQWRHDRLLGWKATIKFLDGPTGYEGYYVDDILAGGFPQVPEFCICAGCDNYPKATISSDLFWFAIANFLEMNPFPPTLSSDDC